MNIERCIVIQNAEVAELNGFSDAFKKNIWCCNLHQIRHSRRWGENEADNK